MLPIFNFEAAHNFESLAPKSDIKFEYYDQVAAIFTLILLSGTQVISNYVIMLFALVIITYRISLVILKMSLAPFFVSAFFATIVFVIVTVYEKLKKTTFLVKKS